MAEEQVAAFAFGQATHAAVVWKPGLQAVQVALAAGQVAQLVSVHASHVPPVPPNPALQT